MVVQSINVSMAVNWIRLNGLESPYRFGDRKDARIDPNWTKRNVIYRWVKGSTGEVAVVGETDRSLTERVDNYASGKPESSAGSTNKKVYQEQAHLSQNGDCLYIGVYGLCSGIRFEKQARKTLCGGIANCDFKTLSLVSVGWAPRACADQKNGRARLKRLYVRHRIARRARMNRCSGGLNHDRYSID